MNQEKTQQPIVLLILDGWGIAPESKGNPISQTPHPNYDRIMKESSSTRLWAHGEYVGLLKDQDGNSEAGHLNLGAGRIIKQESVVISNSIEDGTFYKNPAFSEAIQHVKRKKSAMHLIGMLSDGQSAHSTPSHLYALLDLFNKGKVEKVFLHLFTDGRDSSIQGGKRQLQEVIKNLKNGEKVATIIGRFYAMDRKKEWQRTKTAYDMFTLGRGEKVEDCLQVFEKYYSQGKSDEFIGPHVVCEHGNPIGIIKDNDSVMLFNHRSDRARQLTKVFVQQDFTKKNPGSFEPEKRINNLRFVAMSDFGPDLGDVLTAYPSTDIIDSLPMILKGKKQLYMTEKEKYAHMTYFFNGGYADPIAGEDRLLFPSPDVVSYDEDPAMATPEISKMTVKLLRQKKYDFIAVNFACPDMVAHTGNFEAGQEAIKAVDMALGELMIEIKNSGAILIVTADHGNIEEMKDMLTGKIDTKHSKNQVPFFVWGADGNLGELRGEGVLGDVAPTILELFNIQKPQAMTGKSLFKN
ncbi:2,3-bisphosphoglycerate-independent phosphoglycerate mutase [Patescibacteria group bacterium]|nr:2,3-bisphosphoglycerate-independent phosphoglycerate mutase [Patescibacteria group bacterium]